MQKRCAHSLLLGVLIVLTACSQTKNEVSKTHKENIPEGFVSIPGGVYELGKQDHLINPRREVAIDSFWMSEAEITNAQWLEFIDETSYVTTAERFKNAMTFYVGLGEYQWEMDSTANWRFPFGAKEGGIEDKMDHPVTCISFIDIQHYCEWADVELPTLDQWEVACRAGTQGRYHFEGGLEALNEYANIWQSETHREVTVEEDFLYTSPVKTYKPNPWGLYDMYGNCFELCADNPEVWKDNKKMVCARGGSWWCSSTSCNFFNSHDIGKVNRKASFSNHGFRVVKNR